MLSLFAQPLTFKTEGSEENKATPSISETGVTDQKISYTTGIDIEQYQKISDFYISIPKIALYKEITPNVDPSDKAEYMEVLEHSVAHGKYTSLPYIENGNTYLFAHSKISEDGQTPNGGWFSRINELEDGDIITLVLNGTKYDYRVKNIMIVQPEDISIYSGKSVFEGHNSLTLQTCYPIGTIEKRLIVQAIEI